MTKLQIKNMVCPRCIMAVENALKETGIQAVDVRLGEVLLTEKPTDNKLNEFKELIEKLGFELLDDKNSALINRIKTLIIQKIQEEDDSEFNLTELITNNINKDYSRLSKLFSSTAGITIEQFTIHQKIEKVKELLIYDELSLKEIAYRLGYSSSAHLSAQFKKITGLTPTRFKRLTNKERKPIDEI